MKTARIFYFPRVHAATTPADEACDTPNVPNRVPPHFICHEAVVGMMAGEERARAPLAQASAGDTVRAFLGASASSSKAAPAQSPRDAELAIPGHSVTRRIALVVACSLVLAASVAAMLFAIIP